MTDSEPDRELRIREAEEALAWELDRDCLPITEAAALVRQAAEVFRVDAPVVIYRGRDVRMNAIGMYHAAHHAGCKWGRNRPLCALPTPSIVFPCVGATALSVAHEFAHHLSWGETASHGPAFCAALVKVVAALWQALAKLEML